MGATIRTSGGPAGSPGHLGIRGYGFGQEVNFSVAVGDIKPHGTWELAENGGCNNGGPLSLNTGPGTFSCSGDTLRFFGNAGSVVLRRELPQSQPGS